ncbi:Sucrose transport protein SUC4 [Abeliophyllum distichum]|uniref:Sucrose transport protein SUC4 n=1 Tax=Abeliophyllum distichum TaxID=126358 RepID=A0ABD1SBG5_9LAMI
MTIPETERNKAIRNKPLDHERQQNEPGSGRPPRVRLRSLFRVASVACGIQFGWALQLSLLTPYVQELGVSHAWSSIIWLCGPLSGLLVQPLAGLMSDRCTSRLGRRRPFIIGGATSIVFSVLIISFSADFGWLLGDRGDKKTRAVVVYVFGFWLLDVANNMTQGPCRALLADLTGKDHRRTRVANAYYSLFMAVGNILGYATGSYSNWFKIFPFTLTPACSVNCANLKAAFILDIIFIVVTTCVSLTAAHEQPLNASNNSPNFGEGGSQNSSHENEPFLFELFGTLRYLPGPVWTILLVIALTWIGWFPFILFDTDWMGREIYGGKPNEGKNYSIGVRMGSLGLMLNSLLLGITSVLMEKLCRKWGAGFIWGLSNILMSLCFIAMLIVTAIRSNMNIDNNLPPVGVVIAALMAFAVLGIPLSITYSVPYALVSAHIEALGLGQGLSMGVLNLAIVIPQVVVSLGAGPLDQLFGGGNSPALVVAAISSFFGGLVAILAIPRTRVQKARIQL